MDDLKRNGSGYKDPTAYKAIRNVENRKYLAKKVIRTIYNVAHLAGFDVVSIHIKDNSTGKGYFG